MIQYKENVNEKFANSNGLKLDQKDDDELDESFVKNLNVFFEKFIEAIDQEDTKLLNDLLQESISICDDKKSGELPSFCFDEQVANSFIQSFQNDAHQTSFKYAINIFQNIYISKFCSEIDSFLPTGLLDHLWNCLSFADNDEVIIIVRIFRKIMAQSQDLWLHFNQLVKSEDFLKSSLENIQDQEYIDLLQEYVYYFTKVKKSIQESDINLCYFIISDLFIKFIDIFEDEDQSNIENFQFEKKVIIHLINSFTQLVSKDKFFYERKRFKFILEVFFLYHFIIKVADFDIYSTAIRAFSLLCDFQYRKVGDNKIQHIEFNIFIHHEDVFSKLLNDLNEFMNIPHDSPYNDIPGYICSIITQLSIQINDNGYKEKYLHQVGIDFSYSFHQMIAFESIYAIVDVLENRDVKSKAYACKLVTLIVEGPERLVTQLLNLNVILIISSFLDSDDISLINLALDFFSKLALSCSTRIYSYPIDSDMENCSLIDLLDHIIFLEEDDEHYAETSSKAQDTKNQIMVNIFEIYPNLNEEED